MKLKELKSIFIVFGVFLLISGLLMLLIFFRDASYFIITVMPMPYPLLLMDYVMP